MLNSGAPGVMLDLEDSVANAWPNITEGIRNIIAALRGELSYQDKKRDREVAINQSKTVILTRPRGLHLEQAGVIKGERMAAALFDVAMVAYQVDPSRRPTTSDAWPWWNHTRSPTRWKSSLTTSASTSWASTSDAGTTWRA
jgi:malate synthase